MAYYDVHCADCGQFYSEKKGDCCPRCGRKDAIVFQHREDHDIRFKKEKYDHRSM